LPPIPAQERKCHGWNEAGKRERDVNSASAIGAGSPERRTWPRLGRILAMALLTFEVGLLMFLVLGTHGMIVSLDHPVTTDFASFYAAGTLANEGTPELVYDQAAHHAAEERATEPGIKYQFL
jgi:hypothetical protein